MPEQRSSARRLVLHFGRPLAIAAQLGLVALSNALAFLLRFDGDMPPAASEAFWQMLPWLVAIRAVLFILFGLYEGIWRYASIYDLQVIVGGVASSSVVFFLALQTPLGPELYPGSVLIVDAVLLMLLLGGVRLSRRVLAELSHGRPERRVLIFGAGDAAELVVRDIKNSAQSGYQPVGLVDDDPTKIGHRIHGVPVLGTCADVAKILSRYRPDEALLAMPHAEPKAVRAIVRALESFKIPIKTLPNLRDLIDGKITLCQIRSLVVEDLLARAPVGLDPEPLRHLIAGRRVMVTGAGGSIGSELCRQIAKLKPATLTMFERYENSLHAIRLELEDTRHHLGLLPIIGDVTDAGRVAEVMQKCQPEIVFHAAAHKHVPLMEENPCEAIKNNVRGTRVLAEAAERHGVDRFILISTDKAVHPTSVMGASKRLAEQIVQAQAIGSGTSFSVVRFGNVLGSNGSVVPRFLEQIKKGGPVTITHPEMRRFFMLIPEAVQLVLHAAAQAESGATYVLEMGEQVRLVDMARDLIRLSAPEDEIAIEFVGLRPGEKLYEELVGHDEDVGPSATEKIQRVTSRRGPRPDLAAAIARIETDAANGRRDATLAALRELGGLSIAGERAATVAAPAEATRRVAACAADVRNPVEQPCPKCQSWTLRRSKARSVSERIRRSFSVLRLFRCTSCDWRGWLLPLQFSEADATGPASTLNLPALDAALGAMRQPARRTFAPRDLH